MIRVNLLPYWEEKKKAGIKRQVLVLSISLALFFIIIGSVHTYMVMGINSLEKKVKTSEERLKKLTQITGDVEKFKKDKAMVEIKLKKITDLEKSRMDPVYLLDEIARGVPKGEIWLTSISQDGVKVDIIGMAMTNAAIAHFMVNLKMSKHIDSVDLLSSKQTTLSDTKVMNFTLSCKLVKG